jgi:hypothetical protein
MERDISDTFSCLLGGVATGTGLDSKVFCKGIRGVPVDTSHLLHAFCRLFWVDGADAGGSGGDLLQVPTVPQRPGDFLDALVDNLYPLLKSIVAPSGDICRFHRGLLVGAVANSLAGHRRNHFPGDAACKSGSFNLLDALQNLAALRGKCRERE